MYIYGKLHYSDAPIFDFFFFFFFVLNHISEFYCAVTAMFALMIAVCSAPLTCEMHWGAQRLSEVSRKIVPRGVNQCTKPVRKKKKKQKTNNASCYPTRHAPRPRRLVPDS